MPIHVLAGDAGLGHLEAAIANLKGRSPVRSFGRNVEVLQGRNGLQERLPGWMHVIKNWSVFSQEVHMLPFLLPFASARLGLDICKTLSDEISTTLI